jgi:hypothetical protein
MSDHEDRITHLENVVLMLSTALYEVTGRLEMTKYMGEKEMGFVMGPIVAHHITPYEKASGH